MRLIESCVGDMLTHGDTRRMSLHRAAAIPAEFTFPGSCYAENHQGLSRQGPDIEGVHGAAADCTASISCRGLHVENMETEAKAG